MELLESGGPIGKSPTGLEMIFGDLCVFTCVFTCVSFSKALGLRFSVVDLGLLICPTYLINDHFMSLVH